MSKEGAGVRVSGGAAGEFDVIIVGGGPGGSVCALFLSQLGRKVLFLDKSSFPRDKVCGDAISGKAMAIVKELELNQEIETNPHAKIYGVIFSSPKGTVADIPFTQNWKKEEVREKGSGYVCRREVFDNLVFQKAKKMATKTIERFTVTDIIQKEGQVVGVIGKNGNTGRKETYRAKVVVGADGATSIVSRKVGSHDPDPKHWLVAVRAYYDCVENVGDRIELHFIDSVMPGYFWIFPLEGGKANVGLGMVMKDMRDRKVNLTKALDEAIQSTPALKGRFTKSTRLSPIRGWTLPVGSKRRKISGGGYVLIGDAACLIDPFSGEGIGNAMFSGKLSAKWIDKALTEKDYSAEFLQGYSEELWSEIGPELKTSYDLQRIGKFKFLLNSIIDKAATNEEFRDHISGMLSNENAKKELASPWFYVKMFLPI